MFSYLLALRSLYNMISFSLLLIRNELLGTLFLEYYFCGLMGRLKYIFWLVLGALCMAFGVYNFLAPNHIATGGTAGMAQVMDMILPYSIGLWMIIINIPLMIIGYKFLGSKFIYRTIVTIFLISIFLWLFPYTLSFTSLTKAPILNTLYGGILVGLGLGFIFKGGASAGGGSILAKILSERKGLKSSQVLFLIDALVILSISLVNNDVELGLWSMLSIYISSKVMEKILTGNHNQKIVHLSSNDNLEELGKKLEKELEIQGTYVKGNRLDQTERKDILFLTVDNSKIYLVKEIINREEAYNVRMMILEAGEILAPSTNP